MMAGNRGDAGVLLQEPGQVRGIQRGIGVAAVNRCKPPRKLALQNVLNRTSAILEYVVVNDYVSGALDGHSYVHNDYPFVINARSGRKFRE